MITEPFENVKQQIGCCGIWCGSCIAGNGVLRALTHRYDDLIKKYNLEGWAPQDFNFKEFANGLESIQTMPLCNGCQRGDGRPHCEIRACARSKNLMDCNECNHLDACSHQTIIEEIRSGAHAAGMFVKTESGDRRTLIEGWTSIMKSQWPGSVLFLRNE